MILFLLSSRLIDFDSYLPVAMELKARRPDWQFRFVTFSRSNAADIGRSKALKAGLEICGSLECLDASGPGGWPARQARRLKGVVMVCVWLLRATAPILFSGQSYDRLPYALWYLLCKVRKGHAYVLFKGRATDENIHLRSAQRLTNLPQKLAKTSSRLFGDWLDGLVYYHDKQKSYLFGLGLDGRADEFAQLKIGLPTLTEGWRGLIADQTVRERANLVACGHDLSDGVFAIFPAKSAASQNQRMSESPKQTFRQILEALRTIRPNALILVRPHPIVRDEAFLAETLRDQNDPKILMTDMHPEVMIGLADRVLVNGATNIQTTSHTGIFIDCTDYNQDHYDEVGEQSLVDGYCTIFIRPTREDFTSALAQAISDPRIFGDPAISHKRHELMTENPPRIEILIDMIEDRRQFECLHQHVEAAKVKSRPATEHGEGQ